MHTKWRHVGGSLLDGFRKKHMSTTVYFHIFYVCYGKLTDSSVWNTEETGVINYVKENLGKYFENLIKYALCVTWR